MSRYYRENPDEPISHDWLEGVPRTFQDVKRVMTEQLPPNNIFQLPSEEQQPTENEKQLHLN